MSLFSIFRALLFILAGLIVLVAHVHAEGAREEITDPGVPVGPTSPVKSAAIIIDPGTATGPPTGAKADMDERLPARAPSSAIAPAAANQNPVAKYIGTDFRKVESGLTDCSIPFDQLKTLSPHCATHKDSSRRCEQFSPSQFPEVVSLRAIKFGEWSRLCSGTLIGDTWVLTAAHCLVGNKAVAEFEDLPAQDDLVLTSSDSLVMSVVAQNAITLSGSDRVRQVVAATVYRHYGGVGSTPPYANDLAVLSLSEPYPTHSLDPAVLAVPTATARETTIAGYGYSNAEGGTLGRFALTWPVPIVITDNEAQFQPGTAPDHKSGFCQGDSGGPVFVGRARGCSVASGEQRPRVLQAVISYNRPGVSAGGTSAAARAADACRNASSMVMQNIAGAKQHEWICRATSHQARGCGGKN